MTYKHLPPTSIYGYKGQSRLSLTKESETKESAPQTFESLIEEIFDRGWRVNNLFQRDSGEWQANLRSATHHTKFALAPTAELALALCIDSIERAILSDKPAPTQAFTGTLSRRPTLDLLARFRQPCDRRI